LGGIFRFVSNQHLQKKAGKKEEGVQNDGGVDVQNEGEKGRRCTEYSMMEGRGRYIE
jgi:hypothetical protein